MKPQKLIVITAFCFLAFSVGDSKSEYLIPPSPQSIFCYDIDLDNDMDIITGHSSPTWGGCGILLNDSNGYFSLSDSIYFNPGFPEANCDLFDNNDFLDIFSTTITSNPYQIFISIIYNYGQTQFDSTKSFYIYNESPLPFITSGDVNGDGHPDLIFAHNNDFLWGIIYNDGTGNFSLPEYHNLSFPPVDITCGDLNEDGWGDVVLCGSTTEIYFSTDTGLQQQVLTATLSHDVLISDFDNDGDNDVITHTTFIYPYHRIYMFENLDNNQFYENNYFQFSPFCQYGHISDLNNDSLPDMIFSAQDNTGLHIYHNKGNFQLEFDQFISIENYGAFLKRIFCSDLDENNFNDIATIISGGENLPSNLNLKFNDGQGNFINNPLTKIKNQKSKIKNHFIIFPNPMKDFTQIEFTTESNSPVNITIYDIYGNQITIIENNTYQPGQYNLIWNGTDKNGKEVNHGTYLIRLKVGSQTITKRVVKIK